MRNSYLGHAAYWTIATAAVMPLMGCGSDTAENVAEAVSTQSLLLSNLQKRCGEAFRGEMVAGENEELADRELVLAIAPCEPGEDVTMALHANVGPLQVSRDQEVWDRSRGMTLSEDGDALTVTLADHAQDGSAGPMQGVQGSATGAATDTSRAFAIAGTDQPLVVDTGGQAISLQIPPTETAKGFTAEFNMSDRVAMPPPAWRQEGG